MASAGWTWTPTTARYRDPRTGTFVSNRTVVQWRNEFLAQRMTSVRDLALALQQGWVSTSSWQEQMSEIQRDTYGVLAALGRGGTEAMADADWRHLNTLLARQQPFLQQFSDDVWNGRLSTAQIAARSQHYVGTSVQAYEDGRAAAWGIPDLPATPGDGSTECYGNCRCTWHITQTATTWECAWDGSDDERTCETCSERQDHWSPLIIAKPRSAPDPQLEPPDLHDVRPGVPGSGGLASPPPPEAVGAPPSTPTPLLPPVPTLRGAEYLDAERAAIADAHALGAAGREMLVYVDANTGKRLGQNEGTAKGEEANVGPTKEMVTAADQADQVVTVHNHPLEATFSLDDITQFGMADNVVRSHVVTPNGTVYTIEKPPGATFGFRELNDFKLAYADARYDREGNLRYPEATRVERQNLLMPEVLAKTPLKYTVHVPDTTLSADLGTPGPPPPVRPPDMTDKHFSRLLALHADRVAGLTLNQIADKHNTSRGAVSRDLKAYAELVHSPPPKPAAMDQARYDRLVAVHADRYVLELSLAELADKYHTSRGAISRDLKDYAGLAPEPPKPEQTFVPVPRRTGGPLLGDFPKADAIRKQMLAERQQRTDQYNEAQRQIEAKANEINTMWDEWLSLTGQGVRDTDLERAQALWKAVEKGNDELIAMRRRADAIVANQTGALREKYLYADDSAAPNWRLQGTALAPDRGKGPSAGLDAALRLIGWGSVEEKPLEVLYTTEQWDGSKYTPITRSYYTDGSNQVTLSTTRPETVVHELGHWLEDNVPAVHEAAVDFLLARTEEVGERPRPMTEISPRDGYDPWEMSAPDQFNHPYMGKVYASPSGYRGRRNTEVVSMLMQALYENPLKLATTHAVEFDWIVNLLGSIRKPKPSAIDAAQQFRDAVRAGQRARDRQRVPTGAAA